MILTIQQRLKIALVKIVINVLWSFDQISFILNKNLLLRAFWNLALVAIVILAFISPVFKKDVVKTYKKHVDLMYRGMISEIYGEVPLALGDSTGFNNAVLGAKSVIKRAPTLKSKSAFPYITAKAHLIADNNSGKILSENNLYITFAPASTTKLMTALVALDLYDLDDIVEILSQCADVESTKLWLPIGGTFYVNDILQSLLISSAGDAGCTLAVSKVSQEEFVSLMNVKAKEIGMESTNFTNPIGLDGENGSHYASVWDMYLLSKAAMKSPVIRDIVKTKEYSFTDVSGDLEVNIENTNNLLWEIPGSAGIKTGRTSGAGEVLIYSYKADNKDLTIIVMASEDRFLDTRNLLSWTLSNYAWDY